MAMQTRQLGQTGHHLTPLGLGTWAIGGPVHRHGTRIAWSQVDDAESLRALQAGLDAGVQLLDCSDAYGCGHAERLIGQAIAGRRDEVLIATKFGHTYDEASRTLGDDRWDAGYIRQACDASLQRLGIDRIDCYQFHIGSAVEAGEAVRACLEELVAAGKIRWFGWSTDRPAAFRVFADSPHCVAVQQQLNVTWGDHCNRALLTLCEQTGRTSLARGPLGHGLLTGKYHADARPPADDFRHGWKLADGPQADELARLELVRDILQSDGRSLVQGALAWLWALSPAIIPIPGFKNQDQVTELVGALQHGPLRHEQMQTIDQILQRDLYHGSAGIQP